MKHYIGPETVHNWRARHIDLPYYSDLPAVVRRAILRAHDNQNALPGKDVGTLARALEERFPNDLMYSPMA